MKTLKYLFSIGLFLLVFIGCTEDDRSLDYLNEVIAPADVSATLNISQDNSGLVTITPNATNASSYNVNYGDGTEELANVSQGESTEHTYAEGTYTITIEAIGLTGLKTETTQELVVSFRTPENLIVTAEIDSSNPFKLNVSATADYAASFEVFFDTSIIDEEPTLLMLDETVSFEYPAVGDYTIRVVALSGGAETTEITQVITIASPTDFPIDFEFIDTGALISFDGGVITVEDNPQVDANNNSATVAKIVKNAGQVWGGSAIKMSAPIDFSAKKLVTIDVWSPRPDGKLLFKVEDPADPQNIFFEKEVTLVGNSDWEKVTFDLSDIDTAEAYQNIVLIFDLGIEGAGGPDWTFYVDNIKQAAPVSGESATPITFETPYALRSFDGGDISIVANPDQDPNNGNTSSTTAKLIKNAGETWGGSVIGVTQPFSFLNSTTVTAKVWSPRAGMTLTMKFEDDTPWPNTVASAEVVATSTVATQWEELTFDFSGIDTNIDFTNIVLIMDNGTAGDGTDNFTIYVDDISTRSFLNFEPQQSLRSFDGGDISIITNPDQNPNNGNTSSMVSQLVKNAGETWGGSVIGVTQPFSFVNSTTVTAKVWSPRTGLTLTLKFEDDTPWPNTVASAEVVATSTVANQWEELTFDFSGIDTNIEFTNLVLIMDNGTAGDGSSNYTIYVDDIDIN
ncbi:hypothetical protein [Flavivirga spongiicola]|uniref:PKD domain-containing protein n=1 Tax=Flavivirga spongiicola TaxID=421621 RepID=A0ABU7XTJ6_9FLAO|nr:hypothetical protein [Flavivirga sp. MEBiC05379]MDO5978882.1 hypothetical protein [Flavivirga sp. MEBiC05379]